MHDARKPANHYPYPIAEADNRELPGPAWQLFAGMPIWVLFAFGLFTYRHPIAVALMVSAGLVLHFAGPLALAVFAGMVVVVLMTWRITDRATYEVVTRGARAQLRGLDYRAAWRETMRAVGMVDPATDWKPLLLRVSPAGERVRLHVRPLAGQTSAEWLDALDQLAESLGVESVTFQLGKRGTVWLDVLPKSAVRASERGEAGSGTQARHTVARPAPSESGGLVHRSGEVRPRKPAKVRNVNRSLPGGSDHA